jgi:hypothetical protein
MLTTEETKRIAKIMFDGGPRKIERIGNIVGQLQMMPDTIRVDFQAVISYLLEIVDNEMRSHWTKETVKSLTPEELSRKFNYRGFPSNGCLTIDEDYNRQITTYKFDGFFVVVHNESVSVGEY